MKKIISRIAVLAVWTIVMGLTTQALAAQAKAKPRFIDNLDGTISDTQTGLMWEKKLAATDARCSNVNQGNRSIHCVNNSYQWSGSGFKPDGNLFTDFVANLNRADGSSGDALIIDRKHHSDWSIPNIAQLRTILDDSAVDCGFGAACINAIFLPTQADLYWSSTDVAGLGGEIFAWSANFETGGVHNTVGKGNVFFVRAVRGGS